MKHHLPITKNSSAKSMFAEIESLRNEIEDQQKEVIQSRHRLAIALQEAEAMRYQINIVRAAMSVNFGAPK